jgi:hyperosmotically inducible protein
MSAVWFVACTPAAMEGTDVATLHPFTIALIAVMSFASSGEVTQEGTTSDLQLKEQLIFRFETHPTLKKYDLDVDVSAGMATIHGDVASEAQKVQAAAIVAASGASKIDNQIRVDKDCDAMLELRTKAGLSKTGAKITDSRIAGKVRWLLAHEDHLTNSDVRVESSDRVVTLAGVVNSSQARARAVELAKAAEGVVRVVDQLSVR